MLKSTSTYQLPIITSNIFTYTHTLCSKVTYRISNGNGKLSIDTASGAMIESLDWIGSSSYNIEFCTSFDS